MLIRLFYSNSCPYCPPTRRIVASLAKEFSGKVGVEEVDIYSAEGEEEAERFEVEMVPTVIFEDGTRFDGPASEEQIRQAILRATAQSR
jgi:predicted DsbA family dithiol-disulfide isomerase